MKTTPFNIKEHNFYQETFENEVLINSEASIKDSHFKNKFLDPSALRFFRNLGGTEKIEQGRKFDLGCTISTSISPDGTTKKLTYFFY